jgi:RNA polymerase sigma-70 factor (sigma-E family)
MTTGEGWLRVPRRDDAAYVEFVAASQQRLRRSAYLMTGDWAAAADATQEALVRVYVAWPRLERNGGLPTYARRALVSSVIDASRRRSTRERYEDRAPGDTVAPDPSGDVVDRRVLMEALAELPQRQRACVVLRYFDDLSVTDTAHALGCSEGTVKSQTSKAIGRLRQVLAVHHHDDLLGDLR